MSNEETSRHLGNQRGQAMCYCFCVHQNDYQLGPIDAPVQLVEYGDFACRHCRAVYPVINQIKHWLGDLLCFVFRHFPASENHLWAWQAAELAEAAGAQEQFWQMYCYLFEHPSAPTCAWTVVAFCSRNHKVVEAVRSNMEV